MKRLGVNAIGLAASETSSLSAFLDLLALDDGDVFALDATSEATIVFVNPTSSEGAKLLAKPSAGVCLVSYGIHDHHYPELRWTLATPLRLPQLREILLDIVDKQRETRRLQVVNVATVENERHRSQVATILGCTGTHEKLENLLRIICRITKGRVVHEICGVPGVEITVFPDLGKASVRADGVWTSAVLAGTRNLTVIPHMGAHLDSSSKVLTLAQFRWQLARALSQGILLPGIADMRKFSLLKWPDFVTLGAGNAFELRICAMLTNMPASIEAILNAVPSSRAEVIALLNGCALVGCLRGAPEDLLSPCPITQAKRHESLPSAPCKAASTPTATQHGFAGLLGKLRAALRFVPRTN